METGGGRIITQADVDTFLGMEMTPEVRHYLCHRCFDHLFAMFIEANPHITGFLTQPISNLITWSGRMLNPDERRSPRQQQEEEQCPTA